MNYLYRMTHIENISHILKHGITHRSSANANPSYVPIGDSSIIQKRLACTVETMAGEKFSPGDFIPFYFYARMPMLYNIQHGFHVNKVDATNIVYIVIPLQPIIDNPAYRFYFSDGHAISKMTRFYGKESIGNIDNILDKNAIRNNDWGEDYVVRERKQAEFLVKGDIPPIHIFMLICHDEEAKIRLMASGAQCPIKIIKEAYY